MRLRNLLVINLMLYGGMIFAIFPFVSIKNECKRMGVFDAVVQWNPLIPAFSPKLLLGAKGSGNGVGVKR